MSVPPERLEKSPLDLDVVLRHRLLPQAGGFEGFRFRRERLGVHGSLASEAPQDPKTLIDWHPAPAPATANAGDLEHVLSEISQFLDLELVVIPELAEPRPEAPEPLAPFEGSVEVERLYLELRGEIFAHQELERLGIASAPGLKASPHRFHIFLRHRQASISRIGGGSLPGLRNREDRRVGHRVRNLCSRQSRRETGGSGE
jgi:hypothetical protein